VFLDEIDRALRERRAAGTITALVVDEAQSLSVELLEELRLLANVETSTEKLLPLVLAGQPELHTRLNDVGLRQLKQRVALRCAIGPFELPETADYIASRVSAAGGVASSLFTREAVELIHAMSGGIPRTISVLCDNALVNGMALGRRPVDQSIVAEVGRDFSVVPPDIGRPPSSAPAHISLSHGPQPEPVEPLARRRRFTWVRRAARFVFPEPAEVLGK
jgi:general secretion pathway protein A